MFIGSIRQLQQRARYVRRIFMIWRTRVRRHATLARPGSWIAVSLACYTQGDLNKLQLESVVRSCFNSWYQHGQRGRDCCIRSINVLTFRYTADLRLLMGVRCAVPPRKACCVTMTRLVCCLRRTSPERVDRGLVPQHGSHIVPV